MPQWFDSYIGNLFDTYNYLFVSMPQWFDSYEV